jgi:hypothetical protein
MRPTSAQAAGTRKNVRVRESASRGEIADQHVGWAMDIGQAHCLQHRISVPRPGLTHILRALSGGQRVSVPTDNASGVGL